MDTNIINQFLQQNQSSELVTLMKIVSFGGTFFMIVIVFYLLYLSYKRDVANQFLITVFASYAVVQVLKILFHSPRPFTSEMVVNLSGETFPGFDHSFPSGHSVISMSMIMFLLLYFKKKRYLPLLLIPFLVGLSRLYLGVHRIEDVLAGLSFGVIVPYLCSSFIYKVKITPHVSLLLSLPNVIFLIFISQEKNTHLLTVIITSAIFTIYLAQYLEQTYIKFSPKLKWVFTLYQIIFISSIIFAYYALNSFLAITTIPLFILAVFIPIITILISMLVLPYLWQKGKNYTKEQLSYEISYK